MRVDLNTNRHAAVAAEMFSGKVLKLGKNVHYSDEATPKTSWKVTTETAKKSKKSRERRAFKAALNKLSRQIVSFAESLRSGIKFENSLSSRYSHAHEDAAGFIEFSFGNGIVSLAPAAGGETGPAGW